jgi:hypothetical protein
MRRLVLVLLALLSVALIGSPVRAVEVQTNIGSYETLQSLDGATAINCGTAVRHRTVPVESSTSGNSTMTADPQIAAGSAAGQLCDIKGTDDTKTVTIPDGLGLTLMKASSSIVLTSTRTLPVRWTGSIWEQRGPVQDTAQDGTIAPPADTDIVLQPSGTGQAKVGTAPIVTSPLTMESGGTLWDGTFTACDAGNPCTLKGGTVEYRVYESGGAGYNGWHDSGTSDPLPWQPNCPAGETCGFTGDDNPFLTFDADSATVHLPVNFCQPQGGTDTYACSFAPALDSYVEGACYRFEADVANTTDASLNINTLGAMTIKKAVGGVTTDLATNDIRAGQVVDVCYDGTNLQMQSTLGNAGSGTALTVQEADANPSVSNVATVILPNGTLTDNGGGSVTYTPAASGVTTQRFFDAHELVPDGAFCVAGVLQLNSGPITDVITCADNAGSIIYGKTSMLNLGGCPGAGTLVFGIYVYHATSESITFAGDFAAMWRRPGQTDVVNNTYGTPVAADVAITTAHELEVTEGTVTPNGTCADDAILFWKYTVDATNFSANAANSRVLGVAIAHP